MKFLSMKCVAALRSISTSDDTGGIKLRNMREVSDAWDCLVMGKGWRQGAPTAICDNWQENHTTNSYVFNPLSKLIGVNTKHAMLLIIKITHGYWLIFANNF